jgi:DNA-binding LytR/AlgR family response regulator
MRIIICDDDAFTMKYIKQLFQETAEKEGISLEFACLASSAAEVLNYIRKNEGEFIFFLDLDLGDGEMNGIDLAAKIRTSRPNAKIVFITSHSEKTIDILKSGVEPFGYIEKDLNQNLMIRDMQFTIRKLLNTFIPSENPDATEQELHVPIGIDEYTSVPFSQILYIDTNKSVPHTVCIHMSGGSVLTMRATITDLLLLLDDSFRCSHRSVIVNTNQIIKTSGSSLTLSNGEKVALSLNHRNDFNHMESKE